MKKKPLTIESKTDLLPEFIADTVATEIIIKKYEEKYGKGKLNTTHQPEIDKEIKIWVTYLTNRAETHFQKSDTFRKKVMAKGNKGRDYLYMFMYHWIGTANVSTERSMKEWIQNHPQSKQSLFDKENEFPVEDFEL